MSTKEVVARTGPAKRLPSTELVEALMKRMVALIEAATGKQDRHVMKKAITLDKYGG